MRSDAIASPRARRRRGDPARRRPRHGDRRGGRATARRARDRGRRRDARDRRLDGHQGAHRGAHRTGRRRRAAPRARRPGRPGRRGPASRPTVAVAARDCGAATSTTRPVRPRSSCRSSAAARRPATRPPGAAIVDYRVVPLALQPTLADLQPVDGGLVVAARTALVASAPKPPPPGALSYAVDMDLTGSPGWVVRGVAAGARALRPSAWLWALASSRCSAQLAAVIAHPAAPRRRLRRAAAHARTRPRLVTGLAPVMQASLDLGEVAPAVSSHLSDGLALAGLSLSTPGDDGEKQLFAWGTRARRRPCARSSVPADRLGAGETLAISLTRGGRTLGVLRVVAGEPLDRRRARRAQHRERAARLDPGERGDLRPAAGTGRADALGRRAEDGVPRDRLARAAHAGDRDRRLLHAAARAVGRACAPCSSAGSRTRAGQRAAAGTLIEQLLDFSQLERGLPRAERRGARPRRDRAAHPRPTNPSCRPSTDLVLDLADGCHVRGSRPRSSASSPTSSATRRSTPRAARPSPSACARRTGPSSSCSSTTRDPACRWRTASRSSAGSSAAAAIRSTRTRGAGIGLAIVAEYAASMSGVAGVGDAPGGGARFAVSFPLVGPLARPRRPEESPMSRFRDQLVPVVAGTLVVVVAVSVVLLLRVGQQPGHRGARPAPSCSRCRPTPTASTPGSPSQLTAVSGLGAAKWQLTPGSKADEQVLEDLQRRPERQVRLLPRQRARHA